MRVGAVALTGSTRRRMDSIDSRSSTIESSETARRKPSAARANLLRSSQELEISDRGKVSPESCPLPQSAVGGLCESAPTDHGSVSDADRRGIREACMGIPLKNRYVAAWRSPTTETHGFASPPHDGFAFISIAAEWGRNSINSRFRSSNSSQIGPGKLSSSGLRP